MPAYRDQRFSGQQFVFPPFAPVIKGLIIANVVIHLLQALAGQEATLRIQELMALDPQRFLFGFWLWQPITYQFLHHPSDIFHLLFNMLMLWMFGGDLAQRWGTKHFLKFYLICGTGAGIVTVLANTAMGVQTATIGASGAIFGIMTAFAMLYPNRVIMFMMLFPLPAKIFVGIFILLQLYFIGAFGQSGIAYFAHLGGALVAWLYLKRWLDPRRALAEIRWHLRRRRFKEVDSPSDPDDDRYRYH